MDSRSLARLDAQARRKVAYGAHDNKALSTNLILQLFRHGASTVKDRHLLVVGLAASAESRGASEQVLTLLPDIGTYEDPAVQARLDQFIDNAKQSMRPR